MRKLRLQFCEQGDVDGDIETENYEVLVPDEKVEAVQDLLNLIEIEVEHQREVKLEEWLQQNPGKSEHDYGGFAGDRWVDASWSGDTGEALDPIDRLKELLGITD